MSVVARIIAVFRRLGIVIAIAIAFLFGLATTVYLSLRSPEVTVPNVVGVDRFEAERVLGEAGLNFRVRASRPSRELKADTVLFQLPHSGQVVKAGQTVAMDISRAAKEGESSEGMAEQATEEKPGENSNIQASAANTNENRPKRQRIVNKNGNENANENDKTDRQAINANSNTATANVNAGRGLNSAKNANSARVSANANLLRNTNQNVNRASSIAKPSPSSVAKPSPQKASNQPD